jgi:hypothetical protein
MATPNNRSREIPSKMAVIFSVFSITKLCKNVKAS